MIGITQTLHPELNGSNILVRLMSDAAKIVVRFRSRKQKHHGCESPDTDGCPWLEGVRAKNKFVETLYMLYNVVNELERHNIWETAKGNITLQIKN